MLSGEALGEWKKRLEGVLGKGALSEVWLEFNSQVRPQSATSAVIQPPSQDFFTDPSIPRFRLWIPADRTLIPQLIIIGEGG